MIGTSGDLNKEYTLHNDDNSVPKDGEGCDEDQNREEKCADWISYFVLRLKIDG